MLLYIALDRQKRYTSCSQYSPKERQFLSHCVVQRSRKSVSFCCIMLQLELLAKVFLLIINKKRWENLKMFKNAFFYFKIKHIKRFLHLCRRSPIQALTVPSVDHLCRWRRCTVSLRGRWFNWPPSRLLTARKRLRTTRRSFYHVNWSTGRGYDIQTSLLSMTGFRFL